MKELIYAAFDPKPCYEVTFTVSNGIYVSSRETEFYAEESEAKKRAQDLSKKAENRPVMIRKSELITSYFF